MLVELLNSERNSRVFFKEKKFRFLFCFDTASYSKRKNPQAVVTAFLKAFDKDVPVELVIKASTLDQQTIDLFKNLYII